MCNCCFFVCLVFVHKKPLLESLGISAVDIDNPTKNVFETPEGKRFVTVSGVGDFMEEEQVQEVNFVQNNKNTTKQQLTKNQSFSSLKL